MTNEKNQEWVLIGCAHLLTSSAIASKAPFQRYVESLFQFDFTNHDVDVLILRKFHIQLNVGMTTTFYTKAVECETWSRGTAAKISYKLTRCGIPPKFVAINSTKCSVLSVTNNFLTKALSLAIVGRVACIVLGVSGFLTTPFLIQANDKRDPLPTPKLV